MFLIFVPLAFTEDILDAVLPQGWYGYWLLLLDTVLLTALGFLSSRRWRRQEPVAFLVRWFVVGALLMLVVDAISVYGPLADWEVTDRLVVFPFYLLSLAILVAVIVEADPRLVATHRGHEKDREGWKRFQSAIPLLIGTFAAWIGSLYWVAVLNGEDTVRSCEDGLTDGRCDSLEEQAAGWQRQASGWVYAGGQAIVRSRAVLDSLCSGAVNQEYFAQLSQVIPLLIVAVAFEAGVLRLRPDGSVQRAMTTFTIALLCVGEVLAISALTRSNEGCGNVLTAWHEYAAFVLTLEAAFVALALLAWAVAISASGGGPPRSPGPRQSAGLSGW